MKRKDSSNKESAGKRRIVGTKSGKGKSEVLSAEKTSASAEKSSVNVETQAGRAQKNRPQAYNPQSYKVSQKSRNAFENELKANVEFVARKNREKTEKDAIKSEKKQARKKFKDGLFDKIKNRLSKRNTIIAIVVIVLLVFLVWLLFFSSFLALNSKQITVVGDTKYISKKTVTAKIEPYVGKSLLLINTFDVEDSVKTITGVDTVSVSNKWPNAMVVEVTPKTMIAQYKENDKSYRVYDCDGEIVTKVKSHDADLPDLNIDINNKEIFDAVFGFDKYLTLKNNKITEITADSATSVKTKLQSGLYVIWGDSSDAAKKQQVAQIIIDNANAVNGKSTVDVSAPDRPITK